MPTQSSPATPRPEEGLPRELVLRRRSRFQDLFETGRRTSNRSLTFLVLPPLESQPGRVALITPKKLGGAVVRNRLRRRLREIYRRTHPHLASHLNSDLVVLAKSEAVKLDFAALEQSYLELHAKLVKKVRNP